MSPYSTILHSFGILTVLWKIKLLVSYIQCNVVIVEDFRARSDSKHIKYDILKFSSKGQVVCRKAGIVDKVKLFEDPNSDLQNTCASWAQHQMATIQEMDWGGGETEGSLDLAGCQYNFKSSERLCLNKQDSQVMERGTWC